jgi:hypothetical protein
MAAGIAGMSAVPPEPVYDVEVVAVEDWHIELLVEEEVVALRDQDATLGLRCSDRLAPERPRHRSARSAPESGQGHGSQSVSKRDRVAAGVEDHPGLEAIAEPLGEQS